MSGGKPKQLGEIEFDIAPMVGGVTINKTFSLNKALPNSKINLEICISRSEEMPITLSDKDPDSYQHKLELYSSDDEKHNIN